MLQEAIGVTKDCVPAPASPSVIVTVEAWPRAAGSPTLSLVRSRVNTEGRRRSTPSLSSQLERDATEPDTLPSRTPSQERKPERLGKKVKGEENTEKERKDQRINSIRKERRKKGNEEDKLRKKEKRSEKGKKNKLQKKGKKEKLQRKKEDQKEKMKERKKGKKEKEVNNEKQILEKEFSR